MLLHAGGTDGARAVNTDRLHNNLFPRFDGTNPGLWREKCLQFFMKFNICKPFWTTTVRMHMDGKAKEWFEVYRLHQVVGDWSEFMEAVEANFGNVISARSTKVATPMSPTTGINTPDVTLSKPSTVTASTSSQNVFVEMLLSPTLSCNLDVVQPSVVPTPAAVEVQMTHLMDMVVTTPLVVDEVVSAILGQEKVQGSHAPNAFNTMYEVVWDDEIEHVLTHVGSLSLFREVDER
jgi:hypothetical protein